MRKTLLAAAVASLGVQAAAEVPCGPAASVAATLADRYGESPVGVALTAAGQMMTIYAHPTTGAWTLVVVRPGGVACVPAHGTAWEAVAPAPAGEDG